MESAHDGVLPAASRGSVAGASASGRIPVRLLRPGCRDVRPGNRDALAIFQRIGVIAPAIHRWKGNGVTFQMSCQTPRTEKYFLCCSPAELLIGPDGPLTVRSGRHQCALEDGRWCSPLPPQLPDSTYLQCFAGDELSKSRHMCAPACISWRLNHNLHRR